MIRIYDVYIDIPATVSSQNAFDVRRVSAKSFAKCLHKIEQLNRLEKAERRSIREVQLIAQAEEN